MSEVVDLKGQVLNGTDSNDAKVALRALLEDMESGKITAEMWIFIYVQPDGGGIAVESLDSGITVAQAVYLLASSQHDILSRMKAR